MTRTLTEHAKSVSSAIEQVRQEALASTHSQPQRRSGLFSSHHGADPSIVAARERVANAEAREKDADNAKLNASRAVRDARDHAKRLEHEAAEEAKLAKIKQKEADNIGRRTGMLGRHGIA